MVVACVVVAAMVLAVLMRRFWIRQGRMESDSRRFSEGSLELDSSMRTFCRGRSLPPPYSEDDENKQIFSFQPVNKNNEKPPRYKSADRNIAASEENASFAVFVANVQRMLSLRTSGGDDFLQMLRDEPEYLLEVLENHSEDNHQCNLNCE